MDSLQKMPVADRLRRVGSTDQLYSVTRVTVDEGKARGTAMYQVKTGGGLSYEVTADNGLDIGCLSYRGVNVSFLAKNGYVSPYGSHPFEEDFTHTFTGGMLYTCGLLSTGRPTGMRTASGSPSTGGITTSPPTNASGG